MNFNALMSMIANIASVEKKKQNLDRLELNI
jgi:hypothetical protein